MNFKKLIIDIKNIRIPIFIIIIYIVVANYFFQAICPSVILFHLECPACGLTRACLYLLTWQFSKSFAYNPSALLWIVLILVGFISRYIRKVPDNILYFLMSIVGILTVILYFIR